MSRGMRKDTLDRIELARKMNPMLLGPFLGELAVRANIQASTIAGIVGCHDQTVFRWFFGQGEVQPVWGIKVARLVALLAWMHATKRVPLDGSSVRDREAQLQVYASEYLKVAKGDSQAKKES